ncbi:AAA family ATPase [Clostridium sp.]|uniref:AAA family ATPase n=1 Tax=Clostridium sp. TaxID=1506 RepID=UPI003F3787FD
MKIKKLIISAFGPYAEKQTIDFEENLDGKNMFVITGNTGAGKTTIFDAINFALYGEASGSDREGKSLRSDFADNKTPTEVELWFSIRNKDYYVKRTPQYFRAKQRGEGYTESKPTAEMKIKDKTLTGPKEVTKAVEDILGINSDQFKQLVMIPQGEFKKLLNSDSSKKEEIFRKIFGTKVFSIIQNDIKEKSNVLKKSIETIQRDRENRIRVFKCREKEELLGLINAKDINIELVMEKFKDAIKFDEKYSEEVKDNIKKIEDEISKLSKEFTLADENNKKIEKVEKCKIELEELIAKANEYKDKSIMLERGKKAITVGNFEEKYNEKKKLHDSVSKELKESKLLKENLEEDLKKAEECLSIEKGKEEERNKISKNIDEYEKLKDKAAKYESIKNQFDLLKKKLKSTEARKISIDIEVKSNENTLKEISIMLDEIKKIREEKSKLDIENEKYEGKLEKINRISSAISKWLSENDRHENGIKYYSEVEKKYKNLKNIYEELEDIFKKNQAGILARNLEEGEECPVCGSTSHPRLAILDEKEVTEEAVKKSKVEFEAIGNKKEEAIKLLTEIKTRMDNIFDETINSMAMELLGNEVDITNSSEDINIINEKINQLNIENNNLIKKNKERIEGLNKLINTEGLKLSEKEQAEKAIVALRKELEEKNEELVNLQGKFKSQEVLLEEIRKEFNGEIKTKAQLDLLINDEANKLKKLKELFEKVEELYKKVKTSLDNEKGRFQSLTKSEEESKSSYEEALNIFKENVLSLGFEDYKDYIGAKISEQGIIYLEEEISKYNTDVISIKNLYSMVSKDAEGLTKIDLMVIKEKLEEANEKKIKLVSEDKEIFADINHNKSIIEDIKKFTKSIENDEKEYKVVGNLSKIVNGENLKRISFERYVLAAYFEDIIAAANVRFSKITGSRYELLRKEDIGDKRKGQGLDLEVFDNYTGKSRDIKTLSGGESFKASLSMALGLADVVQSYAGGIQLDTMFIDEGFGTLDPESLDNAIECLIDLQNDGRLVGVISHVEELKDRIEARLEVISTNKGSKVEFKI